MRINCHAHIFNASSIFTPHTLDILLNRIIEMELPEVVKVELAKQIRRLIKKGGEYLDEEYLFTKIVRKISQSDDFKKMLESLSNNHSLKLEFAGGTGLEDYAVEKLVGLFGRISDAFDKGKNDASKTDLLDVISFLRIAFLPGITHVTDHLMSQLARNDAVIALTMDITKDGKDAKLFEKQLRDTSEMVLAYPGRLFPFIAVNPRRPNHFEIMERALNGMGFVGVKLYPSLGYDVDSPKMEKVYAYCEERNIPLLTHCSEGGFYYRDKLRKNSHPKLWDTILNRHKTLKISFGHFGGAKYLAQQDIPPESWSQTILDLMTKYEGVYTDIAYHSEPMKGGTAETYYFKNLGKLLKDSTYKRRILFGTDFFLARQRLKEKNQWRYFQKLFNATELKLISEVNPPDFLGLPKGNKNPTWSINNYINFVYQNRDRLMSDAPQWLKNAIKHTFGPSAKLPQPTLGPKWSWNNKAHAFLYVFLAEGQLSTGQKEKGFDAVGMFKMRDLTYWNKGFEANEIWNRKLAAMAENMDTFFRTNGAEYENKYDEEKAIGTLEKALNTVSTYVFELGALCDGIYRYPSE